MIPFAGFLHPNDGLLYAAGNADTIFAYRFGNNGMLRIASKQLNDINDNPINLFE